MAHVSEPVIVLYESNTCPHCKKLGAIWENVKTELKRVHYNIRFASVMARDNSGVFDENLAPKDMIRFAKWFPMILLVPGRLWDTAMSHLGPKNTDQLRDGVQIMNGTWVHENGIDEVRYAAKYDIRKVEDFGKWLRESLENPEFKKAQSENKIVVPTTQTNPQPFQPFLSNIIRPVANNPINNNYVPSNSTERNNLMEPGGDVCRMRIISRYDMK